MNGPLSSVKEGFPSCNLAANKKPIDLLPDFSENSLSSSPYGPEVCSETCPRPCCTALSKAFPVTARHITYSGAWKRKFLLRSSSLLS